MKGRTVLVCGGRDYSDRAALFGTLDVAHSLGGPISMLLHGGASGADALAAEWARTNGVPYRGFPANWREYDKAAGPLRNQRMLDEGGPDLVVAFPGGGGTADMVRRAREVGVTVIRIGK